ncbi:type II toxin-antitoxin system Phd/YefM family antitoxin [Thiomicrospira microaerophila]|uniref:type II toxin-antitoxin system Phd/YefM family antitoxin n=1 Tax=Thiomicrospira microaerophila TaxID=406020 RepID=UPI0012FE1AB6|nr:type II toxin-antitoxin system Phd/YefM family antitoxin [Thiomicrospira microaerophila]
MIQHSFTEVRNHFAQVLQTLEQNQQAVEITKHGSPCAVILPIQTYQNQTGFQQKLEAWLTENETLLSNNDVFPFDECRI